MNPIDAYLAAVPEPARTTLEKMRAVIRSVVPEETEEVITYGMAAFKYKGNLVGFAAYPDHCGFFVFSGTLLGTMAEDVKKYKPSKGGIQFPVDKPLPAALVKKIVKMRLTENMAHKAPATKKATKKATKAAKKKA